MFYLRPIHNPAKSLEAGSPQFDDEVFVRIHPPGERLNIIERRATDADKRRFPHQWMQYKENAPQQQTGTPIDMLFPDKPSIAAALKASGVHTIEQCAQLSAHAIESIGMGAQQWTNDAQKWMEVANKGVKASQLKAVVEEKDREIHSLNHKIDLLESELNKLRDHATKTNTMEDVQHLLANQGNVGKRGVFAPGKLGKAFDAQEAQINATHRTADLAKPVKRARNRIT
jgi:hypothetical protein